MSVQKISVYSLPDLKNTSDDALPNFLKSLKFQPRYFVTDVRLALGYTAVVIAAVLFYFDLKHDWSVTKGMTLWAVIAYFILNSALASWIWFVEKGQVFEGTRNGESILIASSVQKHKPIYRLDVVCRGAGKDSKERLFSKRIEAPFTKWFTAKGEFVAPAFQEWLASEVPLIRKSMPASKK